MPYGEVLQYCPCHLETTVRILFQTHHICKKNALIWLKSLQVFYHKMDTKSVKTLVFCLISRYYLKCCLGQMQEYVEERLHLEFHFYLGETGKAVRILRQSSKKIKRRLRTYKRLYAKDGLDLQTVGRSLTSYYAHLRHGDTWYLRQNIARSFVLRKCE